MIFADNTTLLTLFKISNWAKTWKVKFGAEKLRTVIFTNITPQVSPSIVLNSDSIKQVETHKHLGISLTYNLDWSPQVHNVIMKENRKLAVFGRIFCLQRKSLEMLYKVTLRSVIDFALPDYRQK